MASVSDNRIAARPTTEPIACDPRWQDQTKWTTVTIKRCMAVTGAGLLGFVVAHLLGNLQIYVGQDAINAYAEKLKSMPLLLWTARTGLIFLFAAHMGLAIRLKQINRVARPQRYAVSDPVGTTLASRTMLMSGCVIFAFLVYHLLHFTLGVTDPNAHQLRDAAGRHDVYSMVVMGFQNPVVSLSYIVAMLFLGLHLSHATSSMLQTLGLTPRGGRHLLHRIGIAITAVIVIGNISIPLSILAGLIRLPTTGVTP